MKIKKILCEYLENPIGIDILNPRITWNLEDVKKQLGYEIKYTINDVVFTTGIIKTSSMYHVFKDTLRSKDRVRYQIRILDENNEYSDYSMPQSFEMGLLDRRDWECKWISGNYNPKKKNRYPVDYFLKEFDINEVESARLYISSCGLYEAMINDIKVGEGVLTPGSTDYRKRIQYQSYDVTTLLKNGKNTIKVALADGWYRGSIGAKGFRNVFGKETKFLAQLEIKTTKKITKILTDHTWRYSNDGPLLFADLKDGEICDNRKTPTYLGFAKEVKFDCNLTASNNEVVVENEIAKPIRMWKTKKGNTILEFENNRAGYISFSVEAKENDKLDICMGEMLDSEGELTLKNIQCITRGRRSPLQEVHFICKEGLNNYHSKFMVAGFKYLSISSNVLIKMENFNQIALYTKLRETSSFSCSNELINIFYQNTLRSLKSNSIDVPTDCPTRERMGWTGDSQVFFETASYLTDYQAFTRKHLEDVFDRQDKNGRLPHIAPYNAEDWFMDVMNGSVGWADVGILTPYRYYKKYGDKRILTKHFADMERYAKFMIKRCGRAKGIYSLYAKNLHLSKKNRKYQVNTGQSYGEWAEPADVKAFVWTDFCEPHPEESMAYTAWMMKLMSEICDIVGNKTNKALYDEYYQGVKEAYKELITKKEHSLDTSRQAKLVRPLYLDLLENDTKEYAKNRLIQALDEYKWRLGTGFLSTPFILYVLQDINKEYAYKLLENEEKPGWLFMSKNNTGTIWEAWEGPLAQQGIASLNHYSKGAVVEWLFKGMCGIIVRGENEFTLKPIIGGTLTYAFASYESMYGKVSLGWKKEEDKVIFNITVPSNTIAHFIYNNETKELTCGSYTFSL